jgi:methyl-accepting chemotaxis protein
MPVSQIAEKLMKRAKELEDEVDVLSSGFERLRSVRAQSVELIGHLGSHVQRIKEVLGER